MKAGTAQKMILNTISSVLMMLGHVKGNRMVDMQLSNKKLQQRAIRMVCESSLVSKEKAIELLRIHGRFERVLNHLKMNKELIFKGLSRLFIAILFAFTGPVIYTSAVRNEDHPFFFLF